MGSFRRHQPREYFACVYVNQADATGTRADNQPALLVHFKSIGAAGGGDRQYIFRRVHWMPPLLFLGTTVEANCLLVRNPAGRSPHAATEVYGNTV
jgi:hypothetical protein